MTSHMASFTVKNSDGASVDVHLQGAHITKWTTSAGLSPIYMSPKAIFEEGKALRGGVPVCWPQFSDMGPLSSFHGVARTRPWTVDEASVADGVASFDFAIAAGDEAAPGIHASARLTVTVRGSGLKIELAAKNLSSDAPLSFTTALHTYFNADVANLEIRGVLDNCEYADNLKARAIQPPAPIRKIEGETDRVYKNAGGAGGEVLLSDAGLATQIRVSGDNLPDVVLWNPWVDKTLRLKDLPEDAWRHFVCVEHGAILTPVKLLPGESWSGAQLIEATPLSKASNL